MNVATIRVKNDFIFGFFLFWGCFVMGLASHLCDGVFVPIGFESMTGI
jgi:hypothetical protein